MVQWSLSRARVRACQGCGYVQSVPGHWLLQSQWVEALSPTVVGAGVYEGGNESIRDALWDIAHSALMFLECHVLAAGHDCPATNPYSLILSDLIRSWG